MKIALCIPYNPLEEVGGLELGAVRLAQGLQQAGEQALILSLGPSGSYHSVQVRGFQSFAELCQHLVINAEGLDIIQWMEIFPNPGEINLQCMTSGILRALGKAVVLMVATSGNLKNRGGDEVARCLIRKEMDAYVTFNPDQNDEFAAEGVVRMPHMLGSGLDTDREFVPVSPTARHEIREHLELPQDKVICLFVGRFVERKRPDFMLRSWQNMRELYSRAHLVVVGSGMGQDDSIGDSIVELARSTQAATFRDVTDQPSLYYQASDLLLLPSVREGQPNVLLEMLACGNPVLGSDIAGIREALRHNETGLLFPVDSQQDFEDAIRCLVLSPEIRLRMGAAGRRLIVEERSIPVVAGRYLALYRQLRQ